MRVCAMCVCREESLARLQDSQQMSRYLSRPIQSRSVQSKARSKSTCCIGPVETKKQGRARQADGMVD